MMKVVALKRGSQSEGAICAVYVDQGKPIESNVFQVVQGSRIWRVCLVVELCSSEDEKAEAEAKAWIFGKLTCGLP
jgi:hypothetical protein